MSPLKPARRKATGYIWLVTFGDLLTLLLGFFIAIISATAKNPTEISKVTPQNHSDVQKMSSEAEPSGTRIAPKAVGSSSPQLITASFEMVLSQRAFAGRAQKLSDWERKRVKSLARSGFLTGRSIEIQICAGTREGPSEVRRHLELARATELYGQVIDTGFPAARVRVRPVGKRCEVFAANGKPHDVALIKFQSV